MIYSIVINGDFETTIKCDGEIQIVSSGKFFYTSINGLLLAPEEIYADLVSTLNKPIRFNDFMKWTRVVSAASIAFNYALN